MIPGAFKYKNNKSTDFKIISRSINRPLLPVMKSNLMSISGRHGYYDFENNDYLSRQIIMAIVFIGRDFKELRIRAREIAAWLATKKYEKLIFDDEPDKFYLARVYDDTPLENFFRMGRAEVIFDCQPFAYSIELHDKSGVIETSSNKLRVITQGSIATPPLIKAKNLGGIIQGFEVSIEYETE